MKQILAPLGFPSVLFAIRFSAGGARLYSFLRRTLGLLALRHDFIVWQGVVLISESVDVT
ncbi:MAG: hypothetical protein DMF15_00130 [Verrucomicrobia bacterium]|nr:MAG: hypothetical protein DMF15_00130 [Verrucomicrobiota bacterium]